MNAGHQAVNQREYCHNYNICHNAAEEALHCFFRANFRTELMLSEKCSGKISPCVRNPGGAKRQNYICQAIRTDVQQLRQCAERAGHQQHHSRNVQTVLILGALMQQHHFCKNSGQAEQRYRCNCCRVFVICEKRERCAVDKGSSHRNAAMETLSGTKQFKQGNADQRGNGKGKNKRPIEQQNAHSQYCANHTGNNTNLHDSNPASG